MRRVGTLLLLVGLVLAQLAAAAMAGPVTTPS